MSENQKINYRDIKISGGPAIQEGDTVTLLYRVALSEENLNDNQVLESNFSPESPIEIFVKPDELLEGVYLGLIGMKAGGSIRRLFLSPDLGYGSRGWGIVPPDTPLVVEILVSVITRKDEN